MPISYLNVFFVFIIAYILVGVVRPQWAYRLNFWPITIGIWMFSIFEKIIHTGLNKYTKRDI